MPPHKKILKKMVARPIPSDVRWSELKGVLEYLGYECRTGGKTGGSRRKFYNKEYDSLIICHEPHNPALVARGCVKDVVQTLKDIGLV